ncbi:hypothetical protein HK102_005200, partial [Quaeritorhiza haematococci]
MILPRNIHLRLFTSLSIFTLLTLLPTPVVSQQPYNCSRPEGSEFQFTFINEHIAPVNIYRLVSNNNGACIHEPFMLEIPPRRTERRNVREGLIFVAYPVGSTTLFEAKVITRNFLNPDIDWRINGLGG